eukprot:TRINITY_DN4228_c1_g2_i2.p1 TRINITY_DN4228_c1_g2~~TRINITY_DN4228_c1_g2_i2.p1  ORF type:complete len:727 (+),score=228.83 TRINITY_DN4228_c1_g2_i2:477-2657(+)
MFRFGSSAIYNKKEKKKVNSKGKAFVSLSNKLPAKVRSNRRNESARMSVPKKSGFVSNLFSFGSSSSKREESSDDDSEEEEECMMNEIRENLPKEHEFNAQDTNVVGLSMDNLLSTVNLSTGDPQHCEGCNAVLSSLSSLRQDGKVIDKTSEDLEAGEFEWVCEYCNHSNSLMLDPEEIPEGNVVDYFVAAPKMVEKDSVPLTVFVLDVSGSMCTGIPVGGSTRVSVPKHLRQFAETSQTYGEKYVSRLECVQRAMKYHIQGLATEQPDSKVCLITFSRKVTIVGDGLSEQKTLAGDRLHDYEQLVKVANEYNLDHTVSEGVGALLAHIEDLEENGPTALGPAMVVATAMASRTKGSKVVVCTDGLANVGLGSLDELTTDEKTEEADAFYDQVGEFARSSGVRVDVIGIKGEGVDIERLSAVAEKSAGTITKVDPLRLEETFGDALQQNIIATDVTATLYLHNLLRFKDSDSEGDKDAAVTSSDDANKRFKAFGNVTSATEIAFEYELTEDIPSGTQMQFQIQVSYTKLDGGKYMRCVVDQKTATDDVEEVTRSVDTSVLASHADRVTAQRAKDGDYEGALKSTEHYRNVVMGTVQNTQQAQSAMKWQAQQCKLENVLNNEVIEEAALVDELMDSSMEEGEEAMIMDATESVAKPNPFISKPPLAKAAGKPFSANPFMSNKKSAPVTHGFGSVSGSAGAPTAASFGGFSFGKKNKVSNFDKKHIFD